MGLYRSAAVSVALMMQSICAPFYPPLRNSREKPNLISPLKSRNLHRADEEDCRLRQNFSQHNRNFDKKVTALIEKELFDNGKFQRLVIFEAFQLSHSACRLSI
jgi:hypothetical protein